VNKKAYISLILFLCSFIVSRAGEGLKIEGDLDEALSGGMVVLEKYFANDFVSIASREIPDDLTFSFGSEEGLEPGLFRISLVGMDLAQIFYSGEEGAQVHFILGNGGESPRVEVQSTEQELYGALQYQMMEPEMQISGIIRSLNAIDPFDPLWMSKTDSLERLLDQAYQKKNEAIDAFIIENEGTFTASVLAPLAKTPVREEFELYETRKSYISEHLLDFVDWDMAYIFNCREVGEKIHEAFMSYTTYGEVAIAERTNSIMADVMGNKEAEETVAGIICEFLIQNRAPTSTFEELAFKYFEGCESGAMFPKVCEWVQNRGMNENGIYVVPEQMLEAISGDSKVPARISGDDNYILGFWSPDCPKCLKALPEIIEYSNQSNTPMHLIAIGGEKEMISKLLDSYGYMGEASLLSEGWADPLMKQLLITSSPELLLVSSEHQILGRSTKIQELKHQIVPN
jgi:thiol-disulfide isomerase/thioredoxin